MILFVPTRYADSPVDVLGLENRERGDTDSADGHVLITMADAHGTITRASPGGVQNDEDVHVERQLFDQRVRPSG